MGGQRLGGSRTTRRIPNATELEPDAPVVPGTRLGQQVTFVEPSEPSRLSRVRTIVQRKARHTLQNVQDLGNTISEGASNIRHRLIGRIDGRGNYSQAPNVDDDMALGQQIRDNPSMSIQYWGN